jgi:hypothetical protein
VAEPNFLFFETAWAPKSLFLEVGGGRQETAQNQREGAEKWRCEAKVHEKRSEGSEKSEKP